MNTNWTIRHLWRTIYAMRIFFSLLILFTTLSHTAHAQREEQLNHLLELSCGADLIARDDARKAVIRLIGDVFPQIDANGQIVDGMSVNELSLRTQASHCLEKPIQTMINDFKTGSQQQLTDKQHIIFHDLVWANSAILEQMYEQALLQENRVLFSEPMVPVLQRINRAIPFKRVASTLDVTPEALPHIIALQPFIHQDLPVDQAEDRLREMAQRVTTWRAVEPVTFGTELLFQIMARNLFHLSDRGRQARLQELQTLLEDMSNSDDTASNWSEDDQLQTSRAVDFLSSDSPLPTPDLFVALLKDIYQRAEIENYESMIDTAYQRALADNQTSYRFKNLTLQEGDILVNAQVTGLGNFMLSLIQLKAMYSHVGVIVREKLGEWNAYYYGDIQSKLEFAAIEKKLGNMAVLRFQHNLPQGFTDKALQQLEASTVRFDGRFNPALKGKYSDIALYCPEMVHHLYTTQFNTSQASAPSPSPFLNNGSYLPDQRAEVQKKFKLFGADATAKYYVTDQLLKNKDITHVGNHFMADQAIIQHPQRSYIQNRLTLLYLDRISNAVATKTIKKLSMTERIKLMGMVTLIEKLSDVNFDFIDFADKETQLYFFKIFMLNSKIEQLFSDVAWPQSMAPLSPQERAVMKDRFQNDILPGLGHIFQGAS